MPIENCPSQECCPPDPYSYRSADAEDSQAGSRANCPSVSVEISPVSGSYLFFPSYVVLTTTNEDAVIRYTLDGTNPTVASTLYSAPFQITQAGQLLKARAFLENCSPGPISTALYQNPPFPIGADYSCTTPDNAGTWDVFAPNGTIDNYWQIEFTPTSTTEVKRLEIYQLDASGAQTGLKWSTDSPPNPSLDDLHNPTVWLKADAIPGLTDGAAIASWPDSTGNGNNAVQATGAKRPLYKTAIVNSKPVVRFDGTDDELAAVMPVGVPKTIILVVKKRSAPSGGTYKTALAIGDGNSQLAGNDSVHADDWVFFNGTTTPQIGGDVQTWTVITLKFNSLSSLDFYLDGISAGNTDPGDTYATGASFNLGAAFGGNFGDYDIAEVLMYDTILTNPDRVDAEDYLIEKYFDPALTYETWPLMVFITGAQQWAAYQTTLGLYAAGTHTWDLYGDKPFPSDGGFWQFDIVLGDDSRITAIKTTNCSNTVDPVPCPSPATPTATPKCDGKADVTFSSTLGLNYQVYARASGDPVSTLVATGTVAASPTTVEATGLTPGVLYLFSVAIEYPGCGFQTSLPASAVPLPEPAVTIATTKTPVDPNESFTISWTSDNIGGATCGGCLDGEVSINQGLGCKAGNTPGSQATSKATAGVYTYEITGCNTCGTVTASVQVEVRDVAGCSVEPGIITISNWTTFLCGFFDLFGDPGTCKPGCHTSIVASNGQLPRTASCKWEVLDGHGGCVQDVFGSAYYIPMNVTVQFITDRWYLTVIFLACGGEQRTAWTGEKLTGNSPLGNYAQTGGCATGPSTITVT